MRRVFGANMGIRPMHSSFVEAIRWRSLGLSYDRMILLKGRLGARVRDVAGERYIGRSRVDSNPQPHDLPDPIGSAAAGRHAAHRARTGHSAGRNYNTIHKVYQDLETDGLIPVGPRKRSTIAEIDREALDLPDSPVDVVIEELMRVIRNGISCADAMARIEEAFATLDE